PSSASAEAKATPARDGALAGTASVQPDSASSSASEESLAGYAVSLLGNCTGIDSLQPEKWLARSKMPKRRSVLAPGWAAKFSRQGVRSSKSVGRASSSAPTCTTSIAACDAEP